MKELSVEDKAKRYDEAIKVTKSKIKNDKNHVLYEDDIIEIFPELQESEDERIRKGLIKALSSIGKRNWGGIDVFESISWLEKQKSVREIVERCKNSWYNEGKIDGMAEGLTNDEKYQQGWHDALEKQGEQKPIMNVPTREVILSIWDLGNEWKELTNGSISTEYGTQLDYIQKHWYESEYYLREKQGEQKPVLDFKASNWYVSKVDGKIHDITYNPTDKVEPKFKVKYAGSEYNVLEVKDIAGVTFYGIEDEPNHIDYVKAENCEINATGDL